MMDKNYIVLVHNNPEQVKRLIHRLDDGCSRFYVHIDKKADITHFSDLLKNQIVKIVGKRVHCIWGDFTIVQATLNCIQQILTDKRNFYTILLSGQDYPLVNNIEINKYLKENAGYDHIDIDTIQKLWPKSYHRKLEYYKIHFSDKRSDYVLSPYFFGVSLHDRIIIAKFHLARSIKTLNMKSLLSFFKTFKKRRRLSYQHYGGSQWWALKYDTLKELYDFSERNKAFTRYHQDTDAPDEIFFHTIIMHLAEKTGTIKIKKSLTYANWTRENCELPVRFNKDDLNELTAQVSNGKLFARKFDTNYCSIILDALDANMAAQK